MSFLDSLGAIFGKKPQSVLGIDIGASAIKVVEIKRKHGKAILKTYGELALGPYAGTEIGRATSLQPAQLAEALKDILHEQIVLMLPMQPKPDKDEKGDCVKCGKSQVFLATEEKELIKENPFAVLKNFKKKPDAC